MQTSFIDLFLHSSLLGDICFARVVMWFDCFTPTHRLNFIRACSFQAEDKIRPFAGTRYEGNTAYSSVKQMNVPDYAIFFVS
jgi:hypothetical protein